MANASLTLYQNSFADNFHQLLSQVSKQLLCKFPLVAVLTEKRFMLTKILLNYTESQLKNEIFHRPTTFQQSLKSKTSIVL